VIPLIISCEKENLNNINYLIENGAQVDKNSSISCSPLNILFRAESEKSLKIINYLIEKKIINIDGKDRNGNTPLLTAYYFRNNKVLTKLLESGAITDIPNDHGDTPLTISF